MKHESVFLTLLNAQQRAFAECAALESTLSQRLESKLDPVILSVYAATGRWVNSYWLAGNKIGRHGYKHVYEELKRITKYNGILDKLVYVAEHDKGTSKYKFFNCICEFLYTDLVSLSDKFCKDTEVINSIKSTGVRLQSRHDLFLKVIDTTIKVMRGDSKDSKDPVIDKTLKPSTAPTQRALVEEIVNQQLQFLSSQIDKTTLFNIRNHVMKSDNKLKALQEELSKIELPF